MFCQFYTRKNADLKSTIPLFLARYLTPSVCACIDTHLSLQSKRQGRKCRPVLRGMQHPMSDANMEKRGKREDKDAQMDKKCVQPPNFWSRVRCVLQHCSIMFNPQNHPNRRRAPTSRSKRYNIVCLSSTP